MLTYLFHHPDEDESLVDAPKDFPDPKIPDMRNRKPIGPRPQVGFVGLENQGATCYLNSLIQVMFMTPELRHGIYQLNPLELGINLVDADQKEEKEKAVKGVIEPDENMVETLVMMGIEESKAKYALIQIKNRSLDEAFDYLERMNPNIDVNTELQKLSSTSKKKKKPKYIPLELQRLFSELQLINRETVSTQDLTSKGFQWQSAEGSIQHDAHELNRLLIDALERSLKKTSNGERLCQNLYEGKLVNQILCSGCLQISTREEPFYDLNMQVTGCDNLAVALHQYCEREILEKDSAYQCDRCKAKKKAYRASKLQSLPQILTFSCNRFKIDRSTNWQRVKITSKSEYPLLLNMNHFMYDYDLSLYHQVAVESDQATIDGYNQSLQQQANESMIFYKKICQIASEFIQQQLVAQCGIEHAHDVSYVIPHFQLNASIFQSFQEYLLERITQSSSPFAMNMDYNYLLHAIIIHRGSAYSGHYFAYIRDNLLEGQSVYHSKEFDLQTMLTTVLEEKDLIDDPTASNGSSTVSSGQGSDKKYLLSNDYIFVKEENTYYLSSQHLIGRMITIFRHEEERFKARNKKKKLDKDKPYYLAINTIAREISSSLRNSPPSNTVGKNESLNYAKVYRDKYGDLEDVMKKFSLFFQEVEAGQYCLQPVNIYLLKETDFELKLAKLRAEERAFKQHTSNEPSNGAHPPSGNAWSTVDASKSFREAIISEHNRSLDADDGSVASTTSAGEWKVANKKHKNKKTALKDSAISSENIQVSTSTPAASHSNGNVNFAQRIRSSEQAMKMIEKELVEILLQQTMGSFYEFNDSHVSVISYEKLEKAFEGVNSSYLLVYRKLHHLSELFLTPRGSVPRVSIPNPPLEWKQRIQEKNQALEHERKLYEDSMKHVSVIVYQAEDLVYESPFFSFPRDANTAEAVSSNSSDSSGRIISLDSAASLKEIFPQILSPEKLADAHNHYIFSLLERYPKVGYYASDPLDLTKTIHELKIKTNDLLLLWNPQSPPATPIYYGLKSKPVDLTVSHLRRSPTISSKSQSPWIAVGGHNKKAVVLNPNIHVINQYGTNYYLPHHFTLLDTVLYLAEKFAIPPDEVILSGIIPNFNSKNITSSATTTSSNNSNEPSTRFVIIYKELKYQLNQKHYYHYFMSCPIDVTEETTLQELWFLREFYVERSLHSSNSPPVLGEFKSVGEEFYHQKSQIVNVSIEITESIRELLATHSHTNELSSSLVLEDRTTIPMKVVKSSTLIHLKEELLHYFGLTETLPAELLTILLGQTQFRLINGSEEITLENEEVTISSLNLKARSKLLLESKEATGKTGTITSTHAAEAEEEISVVVRLIHGNSTDVNYVLQDSGLLVKEVSITIKREKSVRELRDIIGQQLLGFPPDWTTKEEECLCNMNFYNLPNPFAEFKEFIQTSRNHSNGNHNGNGEKKKEEETDLQEIQPLLSALDSASSAFDYLESYKGRRLRMTNWLKEFADLLPERNKKQEIVLIKDTNLKNQDVILFEEGTLPRKGVVNMQIYLWKNELLIGPEEATPSQNTTNNSTSEAKEGTKSIPQQSLSTGDEISEDKDRLSELELQFEAIQSKKENQMILVGEINFPVQIDLLPLYECVYGLLLLKHEKIQQTYPRYQCPEDLHHFLLREFRNDFLPGKCFWLGSATPTSTTTNTIAAATSKTTSTPAIAASEKDKGGVGANSIFRKLGIKNESKSLLIECLPTAQTQYKHSQYTYQVWVSRLLNPHTCSQGKAEMFPRWPPYPITVIGGQKPTIGHLVRPISDKFPDLTAQTIIIYKYHLQTNDWHLIRGYVASTGSTASNKTANKANTAAMDAIKEGDILSVFSIYDLIEEATIKAMTPPQISALVQEMLSKVSISLPEDLFLQRIAQELKEGSGKDNKKKGKKTKNIQWLNSHLQSKLSLGHTAAENHPKIKRKEYALTLRMNLDSSDEESDGAQD